MKKYRDKGTGIRVVEVSDLSFLRDRNHRYGWFRRHYKHHRLRRALKKAGKVIAANPDVATDIVRYYFVPKDKISIKLSFSHKAQSDEIFQMPVSVDET